MTKKKPNAAQEYIPGTEPEKNTRVHNAAKRYAKVRDERITANKVEKDAHETLLGTMLEEGLEHYEFKDVCVNIDVGRKCKVVLGGKKGEENGDGEGE